MVRLRWRRGRTHLEDEEERGSFVLLEVVAHVSVVHELSYDRKLARFSTSSHEQDDIGMAQMTSGRVREGQDEAQSY